MQQSLTVEQ